MKNIEKFDFFHILCEVYCTQKYSAEQSPQVDDRQA
jgi:hypothetical protein